MPTESFFNFFDPPKAPAGEDEDVAEDVEERLELDYQLGEDIKEKLIPRAIDWFTGEALQFEELDEDLEEGDFEDEDDDEDDDASDDRDDEDESDEEVGGFLSPFRQCTELIQPPQDDGGKPKQETAECKQS